MTEQQAQAMKKLAKVVDEVLAYGIDLATLVTVVGLQAAKHPSQPRTMPVLTNEYLEEFYSIKARKHLSSVPGSIQEGPAVEFVHLAPPPQAPSDGK